MNNDTFVPLGIRSYDGSYESKYIMIPYTISGSNAKKLTIQIRNGSTELYKQEFTAPSSLSVGKHYWSWDGFDNEGILDTEILTKGNLNCKITAVSQKGNVFTKFKDLKFSYKQVNWVDVRIDRPNKIIQATVRINLRDGGAVGIKPYNEIVFEGTFGEKVITLKEERPWEAIPKNTLNVYRHPIIKKQLLSFEKLRDLALQGVERYWSRQSSNQEGKNVKIGDDFYQVIVRAIPHKEGMVAPKIIFFTNKKEDNSNRSHNWFASRELYYKVGYIQKSNGIWEYIIEKNATEEFQETAAHEIGHKLLEDYGGLKYSYKHKGTSTLLQDPIKNTPYPQKGEIDLMKYSDDKYYPSGYYQRTVLSEEDLKGLLWLTKMNIIL
ncbi:hypothetical protein [Capnocytophaga gingivalis]|jgi:PAAR domain-containing protein|uniref:hypothetical protein n=1 Tax=Capnocytophaga gingivalis TaxID=1017 RepID=UPI0028D05275|nr:hypothetical protein [Capnocytophaga gingivalis]